MNPVTKQKIIIILVLLIASMYYFITVESGIGRIISMVVLVFLAYYLGRQHQYLINQGELNYLKSNQKQ